MDNRFKIKKTTISEIDFFLNIPSYQRPYCWGKEEVERLLNDFKDNLKSDIYFIGNIISIENINRYDLIDGQQRFTTLWILCCFLYSKIIDDNGIKKNQKNQILTFIKSEKIRINFSIREKTVEYLENIFSVLEKNENIGLDFWNMEDLLTVENVDFSIKQNENIANVFKLISSWFDENRNEIKFADFTNFLLNKLTFEFLIAPKGTDENNLFIQTNINGIQLQHYDILKSQLINALLDDDSKKQYAHKWDNISLMYFTEKEKNEVENDILIETKLSKLVQTVVEKDFSDSKNDNKKETTEFQHEFIIDFNTLLLHTLFIFIKQNNTLGIAFPTEFNKEKLLVIFEGFCEKIAPEFFNRHFVAKSFLDLLLDVKNIINQESKIICKSIIKNEFGFRKDEDEDLESNLTEEEQLQRVLYHTNDYKQYWIGVYIDQLLSYKNIISLEEIDDAFSLGEKFSVYREYFKNSESLKDIKPKVGFFDSENFTFKNFSSYWFYKLEYLIWKKRNKEEIRSRLKGISNFIIKSKNSVEHVFTQKERVKYENNDIEINNFGNLSLITVSQNSSFSSKNAIQKKEYLEQYKSEMPLKLQLIYHNLIENFSYDPVTKEFNDYSKIKEKLDKHQEEMLSILNSHYSCNKTTSK